MAIAVNETQEVESGSPALPIRVDIRALAAAATACRKVRRKALKSSITSSAWCDYVLVSDGIVYGGDPDGVIAAITLDSAAHHGATLVPYDTITAAAKAGKGMATILHGAINLASGMSLAYDAPFSDTGMMLTSVDAMQHPTAEGEWQSWYQASVFCDAAAMIVPATSNDDSRPVLTGVHVQPCGTWCATDSYRLHTATFPLIDAEIHDTGMPGDGVTIPAAAITSVANAKKADHVAIVVAKRHVMITAYDAAGRVIRRAYAHAIDASYPRFTALFPDSHTHTVTVSAAAILAALLPATKNADAQSVITITGTRSLTITIPTLGAEAIVSGLITGDDLDYRMGVYAPFLRDAINALPGDDVTLELNGPLRAFVIVPTDNSQDHYAARTLVMPVKL
jgi:hypothetical protein